MWRMVIPALVVLIVIALVAFLAVVAVGCEDMIEEHNERARQYQTDYKRDFKKRFEDAMKNVNPELPVKKRCDVVVQLVACQEFTGRDHWECEKQEFQVRTMCEAMEKD